MDELEKNFVKFSVMIKFVVIRQNEVVLTLPNKKVVIFQTFRRVNR